jgi:hypothetical protein
LRAYRVGLHSLAHEPARSSVVMVSLLGHCG